ncbi:MAG: hypothetical protein ACYDAL_09760 [Candidatus Dormibacteraceae bacterium]
MRSRLVAVASIAALVGALGVAATASTAAASSESPPGAGVTFSSQPGSAAVVAHYVVSPRQRSEGSSTSTSSPAGENRWITLSPKGDRDRSSRTAKSGVASTNTVQDTHESDHTTNPSLSASFIGQQSSATTCSYFVGTGCNPPDMALGASPRFVLQGVNTQWEVLDTAGKVQPGWPVSAQTFFGVPNVTGANGAPCDTAHNSQPFLSDPRALYDPIGGRFWAAMLQAENSLGVAQDCKFVSAYFVAVSQTSNPNGKWNVYEFDMSMGQNFGADYTQLGIDGQAVYFSANMFGNGPAGGFYAELFEANKAKMEAGKGGFTADGFFNLQANGPGITAATGPFLADTVNPAINLDGSAGGAEVFVNTLDGPDPVNGHFCGFTGLGFSDSCSGLAVWKMTDPIAHDKGGPAPTLTGTYVATKPFLVSPPADQPSCNQCVDALDLRFTGTPVVRDGVLYGTWDTAIDNGTQTVPGIEWAQVDLSNLGAGDAAQTDYYNFSDDAAATFGTVMPDAQGNVVMLFEHMSHTVFPEVRYIVKGSDQENFKGAGVLLKAGEASYRPPLCGGLIPVCRWGDFEAASADLAGHIWFAGEYANTLIPSNHGRNWGTWIGAINAS